MLAEQWLDLGERDRARRLLADITDATAVMGTGFLAQQARLEPNRAWSNYKNCPIRKKLPFDEIASWLR